MGIGRGPRSGGVCTSVDIDILDTSCLRILIYGVRCAGALLGIYGIIWAWDESNEFDMHWGFTTDVFGYHTLEWLVGSVGFA